MKVKELIKELAQFNREATVRFSMANDSTPDPGERWFCEDGVHDMFSDEIDNLGRESQTEVTICLVGKSNLEAIGDES